MIGSKSLVIYRNRPALVTGNEGDRINISLSGGAAAQQNTVKVREKDVEVIYPFPCEMKDLDESLPAADVREAWELLADNADHDVTLKELAELIYGKYKPRTACAAWEVLREGLYFTGDIHSLRARSRELVEDEEKKRDEKQRETTDRSAFLEKLKALPSSRDFTKSVMRNVSPAEADRRFLQDVEALALGKTDKSRTMKDLGKNETPEEAHRLLLVSGAWSVWINPHPPRFGLSTESAKSAFPPPSEEKRIDLTDLNAYAIDSPWSDDPDDAVSLETEGGEKHSIWVHVADPAASVFPGSPADVEARGRGSTLYLPEGASRMLCPRSMQPFVLGNTIEPGGASPTGGTSPALSFKVSLNPDLTIQDTEIVPSLVRVTRLTYSRADELIGDAGNADGKILAILAALADRNVERRLDTGAVVIDIPEAHIHVVLGEDEKQNRINVEPIAQYRSAGLVRECMILAGEGTARWALQRRLAFPFISQEAGELPDKRLSGLAGAWQLRRCMRPRVLSAKPGVHWGLGLDEYTQVTSPLRRYTDLLCHQQIRAWLKKAEGPFQESGSAGPLSEEDVLYRVSAAEAASAAAVKAERASRVHWLSVYLLDKKDTVWDAIVLDKKGNKGIVIIPALGYETQVSLNGNTEPNDQVKLKLSSVRPSEGEISFMQF